MSIICGLLALICLIDTYRTDDRITKFGYLASALVLMLIGAWTSTR